MSGTGIREQVIQEIILLVQKYGIEKGNPVWLQSKRLRNA